jgi:hypothetical protein
MQRDASEMPQDTGEMPQDTGEMPQDTGEMPQDASEMQQDTGEMQQDNLKFIKELNEILMKRNIRKLIKKLNKKSKELLYIFFQDVSDADNLLSIVAHIRKYGFPTLLNPLIIVLARRTVNFADPHYTLCKDGAFPGVHTKSWETIDPKDTALLAENDARHIIEFLHYTQGVGATLAEAAKIIQIYDSGNPSTISPMSNLIHASQFIFCEKGRVRSITEYNTLLKDLQGNVQMTEGPDGKLFYDPEKDIDGRNARQKRIRDFITDKNEKFKKDAGGISSCIRPLKDLGDMLAKDTRYIVTYLLAPATGFANLFLDENGGASLRDRLIAVFGQLLAFDNCAPEFYRISKASMNIFRNQFNVGCDISALLQLFKEFLRCCQLKLILTLPTEIVKNLSELHTQLYTTLKATNVDALSPLEQLYVQWCGIKGGRPEIIFDPAVVFIAFGLTDVETIPVEMMVYNGDRFNCNTDVVRMCEKEQLAEGEPTRENPIGRELPFYAVSAFTDSSTYWETLVSELKLGRTMSP